jgi:hypothetical protein
VRTPKVEKKVVKVSQNAESGGKVGILYFAWKQWILPYFYSISTVPRNTLLVVKASKVCTYKTWSQIS